VCDLAAPIGIDREETLERVHPLSEPLGIIESVDPDHQGAASEPLHHATHQRRARRTSREPAELLGLDPDREGPDAHRPVGGLVDEMAAFLTAALVLEIT